MSFTPSPAIGPDLRAALVAMVKRRVPESEVEDIVQATLAEGFASPHAPPEPESFRRWIFGVAKNKVVDYHRRAGRETFELPDVEGKQAPHQEADLLRWAERHLPPGDENKATLDWMLREGDGEKLESIAETENLPAPRVRQRVSRLRRHLKTHWQKEVALLATVGVLMTAVLLFLRKDPDPKPIANEDVARAEEMRKQAFELCKSAAWTPCIEKLDDAKRLDPAGDTQPAVKRARENANEAITLPPVPSAAPTLPRPESTSIPTPAPTSTEMFPPPAPSGSYELPTKAPTDSKLAPSKSDGWPSGGKTAKPSMAPAPAPAPAPPAKPSAKKSTSKSKSGPGTSDVMDGMSLFTDDPVGSGTLAPSKK